MTIGRAYDERYERRDNGVGGAVAGAAVGGVAGALIGGAATAWVAR